MICVLVKGPWIRASLTYERFGEKTATVVPTARTPLDDSIWFMLYIFYFIPLALSQCCSYSCSFFFFRDKWSLHTHTHIHMGRHKSHWFSSAFLLYWLHTRCVDSLSLQHCLFIKKRAQLNSPQTFCSFFAIAQQLSFRRLQTKHHISPLCSHRFGLRVLKILQTHWTPKKKGSQNTDCVTMAIHADALRTKC